MKIKTILFSAICVSLLTASCVSKKKHKELTSENHSNLSKLNDCETELAKLQSALEIRVEQIEDLKKARDQQVTQVGDLTVLSKTANENISTTLNQLQKKEQYIHLLQKAKSKTDSINLALSANLKTVLKDNIEDEDVDIKIDKTVVFINLSDKMLFESGSYEINEKANNVLEKIAKIIDSRKDLEVMVEGYTDNKPISNKCITDNWDLSVKRSSSVVRKLQNDFNIDPNRLIAAGRGEYNALSDNETEEGRALNRRTRIIIMPKLDQFYDLLNPENVPE